MTDDECKGLLVQLITYARDYGDLVDVPNLRVKELAGDLVESLPRERLVGVSGVELVHPDVLAR